MHPKPTPPAFNLPKPPMPSPYSNKNNLTSVHRNKNIYKPLQVVKIDEPDPEPPVDPRNYESKDLNSSDVKVNTLGDLDNLFNKKKDDTSNGITFMSSQINSFNDIPQMNSKISFKLPNRFGGHKKPPARPGQLISKIFNPDVRISYPL